MHSSEAYSWKWVTADEKLTSGPCELVFAYMVPSASTSDTILYDGSNVKGTQIVTLESTVAIGHDFTPPVPVFCHNGIFVDVGSSVTGVFVMWRELEDAKRGAP